jgi:membrane protein
MFDVRDRSSWWKKRLKSLLLMAVGGSLLFGSAAALLAGPQIAGALGLAPLAQWLAWPVVFATLIALLWLIYYILPAHDQSSMRRELFIGAVIGTTLWITATAAFRIYVSNFGNFGMTYGVIGGIIVLLLWLYLTALAILFGGEVAHVLVMERDEHAGLEPSG